jgi:tripeptidyl-peptidase-1
MLLAQAAHCYHLSRYNDSECTRGYPDVSANGVQILLISDGEYNYEAGTSAATPIFVSIITLINQERIKTNKSPVGFLNPVIYRNPGAFNDIVKGSNPGCSTEGFEAVQGWDPATRLGTTDYEKLLDVYMSLP